VDPDGNRAVDDRPSSTETLDDVETWLSAGHRMTASAETGPSQAPDLTALPWRQGRTQPRNVYARTGGGDWKADVMIGQLDTADLSAEACRAHNEALARRTAR
jgi:hypothetical protein